jgi:hypothetical protein
MACEALWVSDEADVLGKLVNLWPVFRSDELMPRAWGAVGRIVRQKRRRLIIDPAAVGSTSWFRRKAPKTAMSLRTPRLPRPRRRRARDRLVGSKGRLR